MRTPKQVLIEWEAAYNARDAHRLIALYHDDAENLQVAFGEPLKGRTALLESFIDFFKAFPDNYTHAENIFEDGEWAIIEWVGGGTFSGPLGSRPLGSNAPTGRSFTLRGCGFFHIIDGKIRFQRGYFDRLTWFEQIGLSVNLSSG